MAHSRVCRYLVVTKEAGPANGRRLLTESATTGAESLDGQLVAMGNVCLGGAEAELALLVEDGWHRRGPPQQITVQLQDPGVGGDDYRSQPGGGQRLANRDVRADHRGGQHPGAGFHRLPGEHTRQAHAQAPAVPPVLDQQGELGLGTAGAWACAW